MPERNRFATIIGETSRAIGFTANAFHYNLLRSHIDAQSMRGTVYVDNIATQTFFCSPLGSIRFLDLTDHLECKAQSFGSGVDAVVGIITLEWRGWYGQYDTIINSHIVVSYEYDYREYRNAKQPIKVKWRKVGF